MDHLCYDTQPLGRFGGKWCYECVDCGEIWILRFIKYSYTRDNKLLKQMFHQTLRELENKFLIKEE
jgi:hypothetical protein